MATTYNTSFNGQVNDTEYCWTYGKSPRGMGSWAFEFKHENGSNETKFFPVSSYSTARRAAVAYAKSNPCIWDVRVCT